MLSPSRDKRPLKPSAKSSQKPQLGKTNEQLTIRFGKSASNNMRTQKIARSPETIKLMIYQLEKQLMTKTKSKNLAKNTDPELSKTKRKLKHNKNSEFNLKSTIPSQSKQWKQPSKKKTSKKQEQYTQSLLVKTVQKSFPKAIHLPSPQANHISQSKKATKAHGHQKNAQKRHQSHKQNYILVGNDLINFSSIQNPLLIVQNSFQALTGSENFSSRNQKKSLLIDERQAFMQHSKVASFDRVNSKGNKHVNYVERSFCESEQSEEEENTDKLCFLKLDILDKKNIKLNSQEQTKKTGRKCEFSPKNSVQTGKIDINQVIKLNNSVARIQKWWRTRKQSLKGKNTLQENQLSKKQSFDKIQKSQEDTIQTRYEVSQNHINPTNLHPNDHTNQLSHYQTEPQSLSQKKIGCSTDSSDILRLRQTAAHIQYSTHEKILNQLVNKSKIRPQQFKHQLQIIKKNLQIELSDIERIRDILKQSAEKVENMMKKTKRDIIAVKKIALDVGLEKGNDDGEILIINGVKGTIENNQQNILETIFGVNQVNLKSTNQPHTSNNQLITSKNQLITSKNQLITQKSSPKTQPQVNPNNVTKVYNSIKIPTYYTELQQFSNQKSSDQQNSFISNPNAKIFNSPNTNSQEYLNSPNSNREQNISSSENLQEEIFACEIGSSAQAYTEHPGQSLIVQHQGQSPFCMTANFQELYKEYQQQQEIKKQIQTRISKQLGVVTAQKQQNQHAISINTSIVAIHKFLLNFFKFYLYYHKKDFLIYMNMPYGESIETRLIKNKMKNPEYALQQWVKTTFYTDDDQQIVYGLRDVIPEKVLEEFFDSYYEQTDIEFTQAQKTNIQLQKIHNRAVFHAFNHALNFFRPYYNIGGAPYLWCSSQKSLTFFCIGEDNIQEVYEKTQMKILKTSSHLCGIILGLPHKNPFIPDKSQPIESIQMDSPFKLIQNQSSQKIQKNFKNPEKVDHFLNYYTENFNPAFLVNLEERLKKKEIAETEEENVEWFGNTFEEGKVSTLLNLTELIEEIILLEECSILQNIQKKEISNKNFLSNQVF